MTDHRFYDLNKKNILIVGLARTGVSAAALLKNLNASITITDERAMYDLSEHLENLSLDMEIKVAEKMTVGLLKKKDMVIVSPGVPCDHFLLTEAVKKNIPVISEIELAYNFSHAPIIAVTGTNGKTTTSLLLEQIMVMGDKDVILGGNIGIPLSQNILESKGKDFLIAEISSFQLEWIKHFKPDIAVITNITPDHLDRHKNMDGYIDCKKRFFTNQTKDDFLILNYDDPVVASFASDAKSKKLFFSVKEEVDTGAFIRDKQIVTRYDGTENVICSTNDLMLQGIHNLENVLAAIATSLVCNVEFSKVNKAVTTFKGLEHRMEFVKELHGIKFINDSKATNVGSVVKAVESFANPVILIVGGQDKGNDYAPLKELLKEKIKLLLIIGETKERIKEALGSSEKIIEMTTIEKAVRLAYGEAQDGDIIMLSPACASFDMFKDYTERGNRFKAAVKKLRKRPFEIDHGGEQD